MELSPAKQGVPQGHELEEKGSFGLLWGPAWPELPRSFFVVVEEGKGPGAWLAVGPRGYSGAWVRVRDSPLFPYPGHRGRGPRAC